MHVRLPYIITMKISQLDFAILNLYSLKEFLTLDSNPKDINTGNLKINYCILFTIIIFIKLNFKNIDK